MSCNQNAKTELAGSESIGTFDSPLSPQICLHSLPNPFLYQFPMPGFPIIQFSECAAFGDLTYPVTRVSRSSNVSFPTMNLAASQYTKMVSCVSLSPSHPPTPQIVTWEIFPNKEIRMHGLVEVLRVFDWIFCPTRLKLLLTSFREGSLFCDFPRTHNLMCLCIITPCCQLSVLPSEGTVKRTWKSLSSSHSFPKQVLKIQEEF